MPWPGIEAALAVEFEREDHAPKSETIDGLFGVEAIESGGGIGSAGRPRRPMRLMAGLLYPKNSFNLSDEELVLRWAEGVYWRHFCGMEYFEPRLPCDATQIGGFRLAIGEDGLELLLEATIETAVHAQVIKPQEPERVIVDSTVQEKAIAHPTDSCPLDIARRKVVMAANRQTAVQQRRWLGRRQAIKPAIGHAKADHRMDRCWLHGAAGDALHVLQLRAGLQRALADAGPAPQGPQGPVVPASIGRCRWRTSPLGAAKGESAERQYIEAVALKVNLQG